MVSKNLPGTEAYQAAIFYLRKSHPYITTPMLALIPVPTPRHPSASIDRYGRCYFDPEKEFSTQEMATMLYHEVWHLLRKHHQRLEAINALNDQGNVACFPLGTPVPAGRNIEDIATMSRDVEENLISITTQAGPISATKEHPFWTRSRREKLGCHPVKLLDAEWKSAENLKVGDYLCVPKHKLEQLRYDTSIDLKPYALNNRAVSSIPLDVYTAWLIGAYVAEGSSSPSVRFSVHPQEYEFATKIISVAEKIGYSASTSQGDHHMSVNLGTTVLGRWLKEQCGDGAKNKHIPAVILYHANPAIREAFLDGLIEGDGSTTKRFNQIWTCIGSVSDHLIRDVILLLAQDKLGAHYNVLTKGPRQIGKSFTQSIETLYRVTFNRHGASTSTRIMNGHVVETRHGRWKVDQDGVWYPIRKIESKPYTGTVYNLTTEDHTYVAACYLVHNCDAEINGEHNLGVNGEIQKYGRLKWPEFKDADGVPRQTIRPSMLGQVEGLLLEEYYLNMPQKDQDDSGSKPGDGSSAGDGDPSSDQPGSSSPAPGAGSCGSCAGNAHPWEQPAPSEGGPQGWSEQDQKSIARSVAQGIKDHAKQKGNVPAGLERWADETLTSKVDWKSHLRSAIRAGITMTTGRGIPTYQRLNRRQQMYGRLLVPGQRKPLLDVVVVLDTSASMSERDLGQAVAEIEGVLRDQRQVRILATDAATSEAQKVFSISQIKKIGGGGTDMGLGITTAAELTPTPNMIICVTDCETSWCNDPGVPVIIAQIGTGSRYYGTPDWVQEVVQIPVEAS
jgi:predicted metal-dependent peptidase